MALLEQLSLLSHLTHCAHPHILNPQEYETKECCRLQSKKYFFLRQKKDKSSSRDVAEISGRHGLATYIDIHTSLNKRNRKTVVSSRKYPVLDKYVLWANLTEKSL